MTKSEKMAKKWAEMIIYDIPEEEMEESLRGLIHQVAERTREECIKTCDVLGYLDDSLEYGDLEKVINDARWEDEDEKT